MLGNGGAKVIRSVKLVPGHMTGADSPVDHLSQPRGSSAAITGCAVGLMVRYSSQQDCRSPDDQVRICLLLLTREEAGLEM